MSYPILSMRLDDLDPASYLDKVTGAAQRNSAFYCCVTNVHQCMLVHEDEAFRQVVNGADLVITDSAVLHRAAANLHSFKAPAPIRGADIMLYLCDRAAKAGIPIGLVGGKDDTVLDRLKAALLARQPTLDIAFAYSPPFRPQSDEERTALAERINASGTRLLFIGLGCPKQERWMAAHKPLLNAAMIGVGAAFDFNAGVVKPSPPWVHRSGLEWLYRMISEPRRLAGRYLSTSPKFMALYARDYMKSRLSFGR